MRLIDADALIESLIKERESGFPANENLPIYAQVSVAHAPTVDAEPVIRCKDCDCAEPYGLKRYCKLHGIVKNDNGFCDEAEPKGKEQ